MPFPRFSRGRAGALTFDTMNEVFDRIEALEGMLSQNRGLKRGRMTPFLGKILAQNPTDPTEFSFEEVTWSANLTPNVWAQVEGGRTSSDGQSDFAYPAVGSTLAAGKIVMLFPMNRDSSTISTNPNVKNGTLVFHALETGASSSTRVGRIMSSTSAGQGNWEYTLKDAKATVSGSTVSWTYNASSPDFKAYNGAEAPADSPTTYGVGMVPNLTPAPQMNRKQIRTGVVVTCILDEGGKWVFSVPNGYEVIC